MDETSHKKKKKKKKRKEEERKEKERCDLVTHVFDQLKNKIKNICGTY